MQKNLRTKLTLIHNRSTASPLSITQASIKRYQDETKGEQALWRAVITQALMDAGSNSKKRDARFDKAQAISWLSGKSGDFITVCALADLSPDYVIQKTRAALNRGCRWRNLAIDKKGREESALDNLDHVAKIYTIPSRTK